MTTPALDAHADAAPKRAPRAGRWQRFLGAALLAVALLAGCGSDGTPTSSGAIPIRFIATNALAAPVTIAVDGVPLATLTSGRSTGMTVTTRQKLLTWTSAKPTDAQGVPIPDDIGEIAIPIGSLGSMLEIANVVGDDTYVTAEIFNLTTSRVSIGVWDGASVACAAILPGKSGNVNGYIRTGYYRLRAGTELRAYSDPTNCTGSYVAWPHAQLTAYEQKSGLIDLVLESPP